MQKEVLRAIENISIYPVFSFVLFFAVFCLIILWVITYDKKTIKVIENLPLNNDHNNNTNPSTENLKP
jgi:cytochrome c oxidase cbb3-type subunit IV